MHRQDFCKLLAMAAASETVPSYGQASQDNQPALPSGFNQYTQDYAQFCALPPEKRVFYKVSDGKIVAERLDESAWQQPVWNYSPAAQSIAGGMWDDVPSQSPIADLAAPVRSNRRGTHCWNTRRRSGIRMPNSASGLTGVHSASAKQETGTNYLQRQGS